MWGKFFARPQYSALGFPTSSRTFSRAIAMELESYLIVAAAYEAQGDCKTFSGVVITFLFISNFVQRTKIGEVGPQ
jgi:hypothetical protein